MSPANKPDERGFKAGANMPKDDYDPARQGMSDSGNHATGHPANDAPSGNQQHGRPPGRGQQGDSNRQSAADAATATTHRDRTAGARGDNATDTNQPKR